jgi:PAS domain-containing protein
MTESKQNMTDGFLRELDNADFLSIFDGFSDGVFVTNCDGVIVYCN